MGNQKGIMNQKEVPDEYNNQAKQSEYYAGQQLGILSRLNKYHIQKILEYCTDFATIQQNQLVCSYFRDSIKQFARLQQCSSNQPLKGYQDMSHLYLQLQIPEGIKRIIGLEVYVSTRDQGWASVQGSSSWVELRIIDEHEHVKECMTLATNYKSQGFQLNLKRFNLSSQEDRNVLQCIDDSKFIGIYARSMYAGWVCHIEKAGIRLLFEQ